MVSTAPTGDQSRYTKVFDGAAQVIIAARVKDGDEYITLEYLYKTLGATTPEQKNGVQWGVRIAKNDKVITSTDTRGVYRVV